MKLQNSELHLLEVSIIWNDEFVCFSQLLKMNKCFVYDVFVII